MAEADLELDTTDAGTGGGATETPADGAGKDAGADKGGKPAPIAAGTKDDGAGDPPIADWRDKIAGGDAAFRKQLNRYTDEAAFGKAHREATSRLRNAATVAKPGENASPEELATYRKANGIPEKADDYLANLKIGDGRVLGEADKAVFGEFAKAMHGANVPQGVVDRVVEWYQTNQEAQAAATAEQDRAFHREQQDALATEWGADKRGNINIIAPLLEQAGAGSVSDDNSLASQLLTGRLANGRLIGDDAGVIKFLSSLARKFNDIETLTEGSEPAKAGQSRLKELAEMRDKEPGKYWSPEIQAEEQKLIGQQLQRRTR